MATVPEEIADIANRLSPAQQQQLLNFARMLEQARVTAKAALPPGTSFDALRAFHPSIPPAVVDEMERAIQEECEQIAPDDNDLSF